MRMSHKARSGDAKANICSSFLLQIFHLFQSRDSRGSGHGVRHGVAARHAQRVGRACVGAATPRRRFGRGAAAELAPVALHEAGGRFMQFGTQAVEARRVEQAGRQVY
jgi:hypothetical protein